mgnify:CR=1 FL=1
MTKGDDYCKIKKYDDLEIMKKAIALAKKAGAQGEIPIAAIVARYGEIIASAKNAVRSKNDPTAHAEVLAIKKACKKLKNYRLPDCTLYTTLEPCVMCTGAIIEARLNRLVIAALDDRRGAVKSNLELIDSACSNHKMQVEAGLLQEEASQMLTDFFSQLRALRKNK